jgi:hypothetical protein
MAFTTDIFCAANLFIEQHGEDAPIQAAMKADKMLDAGDMDGKAVWMRVIKAINELLAKERPEGEMVH